MSLLRAGTRVLAITRTHCQSKRSKRVPYRLPTQHDKHFTSISTFASPPPTPPTSWQTDYSYLWTMWTAPPPGTLLQVHTVYCISKLPIRPCHLDNPGTYSVDITIDTDKAGINLPEQVTACTCLPASGELRKGASASPFPSRRYLIYYGNSLFSFLSPGKKSYECHQKREKKQYTKQLQLREYNVLWNVYLT